MHIHIIGNIYWADPKLNVIEVAKLNGSHRYVVVHSGLETLHSLAVDPVAGILFWYEKSYKNNYYVTILFY